MFDGEAFGAEVVAQVKSHVTRSIEPLVSELALLKARIGELEDRPPPAQGEKGNPGEPGLPGEKGDRGNDGVGLASTFIDRDGNLVLTYTDGTVGSVGKVIGGQGPPGKDGKDGANGKDGRDATIDESLVMPDEVASQISKAVSLVAESPRLVPRNDPQIVLNMATPPDRSQRTRKTITTRKDENGNMVADVVEW